MVFLAQLAQHFPGIDAKKLAALPAVQAYQMRSVAYIRQPGITPIPLGHKSHFERQMDAITEANN